MLNIVLNYDPTKFYFLYTNINKSINIGSHDHNCQYSVLWHKSQDKQRILKEKHNETIKNHARLTWGPEIEAHRHFGGKSFEPKLMAQ